MKADSTCPPDSGTTRRARGARAADLLVEERVARELGHRVVEAEGELAGPPRALVQSQHLLQEGVPFVGLRPHDLAAAELELHPADPPPGIARRVAEADDAVDLRLDRAE